MGSMTPQLLNFFCANRSRASCFAIWSAAAVR